jgi:hypothetical protein
MKTPKMKVGFYNFRYLFSLYRAGEFCSRPPFHGLGYQSKEFMMAPRRIAFYGC